MNRFLPLILIALLTVSCSNKSSRDITAIQLRCNNLEDPSAWSEQAFFITGLFEKSYWYDLGPKFPGEAQLTSKAHEYILISPEIVGDLTWAEASYMSVHGEILSSWEIKDNNLILRVRIPANCRATVIIHQSDPDKIVENDIPLRSSEFIKVTGSANGVALCEVPSGEYLFKTEWVLKY